MKQWWIFKGRSNFCSELVLDDECEKEVRALPEGFYDVVSESDTVEGGIHVVEFAEYERLREENDKLIRLLNGETVEFEVKEPSASATVKGLIP